MLQMPPLTVTVTLTLNTVILMNIERHKLGRNRKFASSNLCQLYWTQTVSSKTTWRLPVPASHCVSTEPQLGHLHVQ